MSGRTWLFLTVMVVLVGVIVFAAGGAPSDSPEHSSASDGPNGTSGLLQYAQAQGHPAGPMLDSAAPGKEGGLLFLFTPTIEVTDQDAVQLHTWVENGGVLVLADERGVARLDQEFDLSRAASLSTGTGSGLGPLLPGVARVTGSVEVTPFEPAPRQSVLVRGDQGAALAVIERIGSGRLVALSDPAELTNAHIAADDNWRMAADLLALAPPGAPVSFDEYHHGAGASARSGGSPWGFGWAQGLIAAAAVLFVGFALRGRAFGPRLPLDPDAGRPVGEYVNAVGTLLKRARARRLTLEVLLAATRRQLQQRAGIARGGRAADQALELRAPEQAARLAGLEARLGATVSDEALLDTARQLHQLALPPQGRH